MTHIIKLPYYSHIPPSVLSSDSILILSFGHLTLNGHCRGIPDYLLSLSLCLLFCFCHLACLTAVIESEQEALVRDQGGDSYWVAVRNQGHHTLLQHVERSRDKGKQSHFIWRVLLSGPLKCQNRRIQARSVLRNEKLFSIYFSIFLYLFIVYIVIVWLFIVLNVFLSPGVSAKWTCGCGGS